MFVDAYEVNGDDLIVKLAVYKTDCKAKEDCGIPVAAVMAGSVDEEPCCSPDGNCC